ncbi:GpE family phage tail protein [Psychrobacter sp. HD31]|uniref:GpE family phage tail protein n=1 Tax=Psychrobacter sp. HD31 TaxID=3112003 RepID=UPI003DA444D0
MSDFCSLTKVVNADDWMSFNALLAKWFHTQPSEIDDMTVIDFIGWVDEANKQIEAQNKASEG